ncbi:hypothetical protein LCGC14_0614190, partial [marine sediment metagenome]
GVEQDGAVTAEADMDGGTIDNTVIGGTIPVAGTFTTLSATTGIVLPKTTGTGIKVEVATPTFPWRDLLGELFARNTGANKPSRATYIGNITQAQFAAGKEEEFEYHIPHDYVAGTDIHLHVHWSHTGATVNGGSLVFTYEISYSKSHNQTAFPDSITDTFTGNASSTQRQQILTEVQISAASPSATQIDSDDLEPDGVLLLLFTMTTNNITVSGGGVPDPFIHYVDIHYQSTGVGTKEKAPDFYAA